MNIRAVLLTALCLFLLPVYMNGQSAPVISDIPDQPVEEGTAFAEIMLNDFVSDEDTPDEDLSWGYANNDKLDVKITDNMAIVSVPDENWNGFEIITFTVSDGDFSDYDEATFTVNPVNDAPVLTDIPDFTIYKGETFDPVLLDDYVTDVDNTKNELTWEYNGSEELTINIDDLHYAYVEVPENWTGNESITFSVSDGPAEVEDLSVFTVKIPDPEAVDDHYVVDEGTTLSTPASGVLSNDLNADDGSSAATTVTGPVNGSTFNLNEDGSFVYTHDGSETTSDIFTYLIDNGSVESNVANVTIEVNPVNDAPVITGLSGEVIPEGNDFADIDLNKFVADAEDTDNLLAWTATGQVRLDVDISDDTHIATIKPPNKHWNGSENITFTVTDTEDLSDSESVIFEVTALAEAPVATNDSYNVAEGGTLTVNEPGVLQNDTDGDSDPLLALVETNPSFHSSFTLNPNGSFTYVNNGEENTEDSFTYRASDSTAQSDPATVAITITSINDAPQLNEFSGSDYTFNEDAPAIQILSSLFVNDPDNLTLQSATVSITSGLQSSADVLSATFGSGISGFYNSSTGILILNGPATPAAFQAVMRTIAFNNTSQDPTTTNRIIETRVYDGTEYSNTLSKIVHVGAQNDPPVVADIPGQTITEGSTFVAINLENYITDPDHTISELDLDFFGNTLLSVSISGNIATITIPNTNWNGSETITFEATDPIGGYDSDPATFTVTSENDPPVVGDIPNQTVAEGSTFATINLDNYVTDPDHADNQITWTYSGNSQLTISIVNRIATVTIPSTDWFGTETITFTATDPSGGTDNDPATFTITSENDPPVVSDIPNQTVLEGSTFATINLDNYVTDPDHADNQITWTYSGNSQLTVSIVNRIATITIPTIYWNGAETITFTATDPSGGTDNDPATFTVTSENDPPVVSDIPNQTVLEGSNFTTINLDNYVTDPDHADNQITWTYSGNSQLTVSIVNRIATITIPSPDWFGAETITFTATDPEGGNDNDQATFAVTNVNDPPVATALVINGANNYIGTVQNASFTYTDPEGDDPGTPIWQWYRAINAGGGSATPIDGATSAAYTPVMADDGKFIGFEVTPKDKYGLAGTLVRIPSFKGPIGSYSANITGSNTFCHGAIMPIILTITSGQSPYTATLHRTNSNANKDTVISGITSSTHNIYLKIPGTYTLTELKDNGDDKADITASQPVVLVINPKAKAVLSGTYEICDDGVSTASIPIDFTAGISPWSVKLRRGISLANDTLYIGITKDTVFNARVIGTPSTEYKIIEIKDANGCLGDPNSGSAWVSYKPSPTATISGLDSICPGDTAVLSVSLSPSSTPNWSFTYLIDGATPATIGNLSSYTYNLEVTSPGIYTLAAVTDHVCTGKVSGTGIIRSYEIPTAIMSGTKTICEHTSGNLSVALTGHAPWGYKYRLVGVDTTEVIGVISSLNLVAVKKAGTYNLLEVYDNNCKGTVSGNAIITIAPAPDVELSGLAPAYDRRYNELVPLTGTPQGTTGNFQYSGPGLILNDGKYSFFPPLAPVGTNKIVYSYRASSTSCWGYDTSIVRILEANSIIEFEDDRHAKYCTNDQPFTVTGTNILGHPGIFSISGGVGLTDHGDNTATINPALLSPNNYTITYTYYDAGLPQPKQASFDVGVSPVADFKGATECFQLGQSVTLNNISVSNFGFLSDTLFFWKILNKTGSGYLVNDTAKDISYAFAEPGNYTVGLELFNSNGCYAGTTKIFTLRPTLVPAEETQFEEFETGAPGWTKGNSSDSPNSWMMGEPSKGFSDPFSGANCWYTLTQGTRPPREQSWVTTPCYDFRGTEKPMLKMWVWRLFNSNRDGANVQFSADSGKTWTPLGDLDDGISWYNYTYIPGLIGDNKIGWCVHPVTNLGNDTEWKEVRHSLDILKDNPQVQFRIAYGSDGSAQNNNGIAFDNFWIGERKRTALIEHFTNSSDAACMEADSLLDAFTKDNELSVINIQYHTSNPPGDPFYEDNPVIPSTREFYYGVSDVPYALLNGGVTSQHSFDYIESSKPFNKNVAIIESLRNANFDISVNSGIKNGNTLNVEVDIVAVDEMPMTELSVRVAVIEREIHGINGNNGDTVFRNVVKAMLPGAAGISIQKSWSVSDHEKRYLEWPLQNIYDISQLRIVAFLQDGTTYEIYQAKLNKIGDLVGILDPWTKKPLKKNFIVYPNPASQSAFVRFESELTSGASINLYNNTGSLVYSNRLEAGNNMAEIPVTNLPDGIYMLRMTVKNQLVGTSKLIISR